MTTLEILKRARARVAKGWHQGWYSNKHIYNPEPTAWCLKGALGCGEEHFSHERWEAQVILSQTSGAPVMGLTKWNDDPGRTQAEVVAAFDKAIVLGGVKMSEPQKENDKAITNYTVQTYWFRFHIRENCDVLFWLPKNLRRYR